MGLIAELRNDTGKSGTGCKLCAWLADRPRAEQAEWDEAMIDKSISTSALLRAVKKRGGHLSTNAMRNHRNHVIESHVATG